MRIVAIWIVFLAFSVYTWRDWYRGALFLLLAMAVTEHPSMPKEVFGVPGLNPWNVLLVSTVMSATLSRKHLVPSLPSSIRWLLIIYTFGVVVSTVRELLDLSGIANYALELGLEPKSFRWFVNEDLLNTFKYVVPAILIYRGCNTYPRYREAVITLLLMNFLLAIQVLKSMGIDSFGDSDTFQKAAIRRIDRDVGYYRSDLAILLAGASWTMLAYGFLASSKLQRIVGFVAGWVSAVAIGFTAGRMGMAVWLVLGGFFSAVRWRRLLVLGPLAVLALVLLVPAVADRMLQGFTYDEGDSHNKLAERVGGYEGDVNLVSVTSGRTVVWPVVLDAIYDAPVLGYGRRAMERTGMSHRLQQDYSNGVLHPHNAYLQLFLEFGALFALPILWFYSLIIRYSYSLFRDKSKHTYQLTGAIGLAFVGSFLLGAVAQQSFYPYPGSVGIWVAMALVLRVYRERSQAFSGESQLALDHPGHKMVAN